MTASLAYAPRPTALGRAGPLAATAYLLAFAAISFATTNPLLLAGTAAAVALAGHLAGTGRALALALRLGATLAVLVVAVNGIASQRGDTVLVRGPSVPVLGTIDVSAEALAEGAVLGLRIAIVVAAFLVHTAAVDPDRLLRLVRPLAGRSALTATLMTRMVPLAARDGARLREAAALRGPAAAPVGRAALTRRLVAGSLDRAVDAAATLELRGYSGRAAGRSSRRDRTPRDGVFLAAAVATLAVGIGARLAGIAEFEAYPSLSLDAGPATLAAAAALPAVAAAPFAWAGVAARRLARSTRTGVPARA